MTDSEQAGPSRSAPAHGPTPAMIEIPAGEFCMGDDRGPQVERPAHRVAVDVFALGIYPVTREEYAAFLRATGYAPPSSWADPAFSGPRQPAVSVNWYGAVAYCIWLSNLTGDSYRLPTEAEREYAARGGCGGSQYPWGDGFPHPATAYRLEPLSGPLDAGSGLPNGFGLYNMGDTVHEWCQDWYAPDYYRESPAQNPSGPPHGMRRVARGGAWRHQVPVSRCAHRTSLPPDRHFTDFGFRVARSG